MRTIRALAGAVLALLVAAEAHAATPPATSPMARGEHPRVFLTAADLPGIRDRLADHYRTEFQAFIDLLNDTSRLTSGQRDIENFWGSMNFAFLAVLGPAEMQARGFSFVAALDTPQEYCARAVGYARTMLSSISSAEGQGHSDLVTGYPETIYVPVVATYDWCYPHLASADRTAIVDAFVNAYLTKYQGKNLLNMEIAGLKMLANNQASADIHDILGIVAFYNDPYPSASLQAEMFDAFSSIWMDRALVELDRLYATGTGWHEGSGGYLSEGFINLGIPVAAFSSALGVDYFAGTPFFGRHPVFNAANVKPHSLLSACGSSGTARCPDYVERWGTISGGIAGIGCKPALLASGALRRAGSPTAALAKWVAHTLTGGCSGALTEFGGSWSNAVLFHFLYGDREVTARTPAQLGLPKAQRLGLGEYVMRTGYGASDTQVIFWANEFGTYGHASQEYGHFSLHKFGNLILSPANSKSGDAVLESAKFSLFTNALGIHKGSSDPRLSFNGNVTDPFFGARGIDSIRTVGSLRAETINHPSFDYVSYDNALAWSSSTVDVSQREFVYLKGGQDHEYLVVLDRVTVDNPSADEKIWKVWIPAAPEFVNGTPTNPRLGKWTSSNTDTMRMTNLETSVLRSDEFEWAPTHGRFFLKTLLPADRVINVLGGPGKEFQSGDDDGTTPWGAPSMTRAMHEYLGWGRIEVRPGAARAADTFLNVIQFGDARTLATMSPTSRVSSGDGKMVGADVGDASGSRVVLFSSAANGAAVSGGVTYTFAPVATASRHLLVNMQPGATYYVSATASGGGTTVAVASASAGGALAVAANNQGVLVFSVAGTTVTAGDLASPNSPRNLRVQ